MQWRLVQGRALLSRIIGWFGGGGYAHADVITREGFLRGARDDRIGGKPAGFYDRPSDYLNGTLLKATVFNIPVTDAQEKKYWEFSDAQLGRPYDSRGILGIAFGERNWHDPSAWFCSEEIAANCEYAGILAPLPQETWRVDPGDLAFLFSQISGVTYKTTIFYHDTV